jgi:hypothetical protein
MTGGWRHWGGHPKGINPETGTPRVLETDTTVVVCFRDGRESMAARADNWRWEHHGASDDIVGYRVIR